MHHVAFGGRLVMLGLGSIGQGVLPLILAHIDMPRERIIIVTADARGGEVAAALGIRTLVQPLDRQNYREMLASPARRGGFPAQPLGGRLLGRADHVLPRVRRALSRHLHRALGRRLYRSRAFAFAAVELRPERKRAGACRRCRSRADRRGGTWRQSRACVAFRQAGAARYRARYRGSGRCSRLARGVGGACAGARRAGHPCRRARHPGRQRCQAARRVRQHLVDRRLRRRGLPAGGAWLGHARRTASRGRAPATNSAAMRQST